MSVHKPALIIAAHLKNVSLWSEANKDSTHYFTGDSASPSESKAHATSGLG